MNQRILQAMAALLACWGAHAQVNSGSNGSDGAFNPTTNIVINMADHPDGIYHYTSVNISNGVTVTFIPNANNTPVIWLVQSNVVINGVVDVSGQTPGSSPSNVVGAAGGPGGFRGGNGGDGGSGGQGPGSGVGQAAAFGTLPLQWTGIGNNYAFYTNGTVTYGNQYLVPLIGGSGGGGVGYGQNGNTYAGGGGGGGALLIAASQVIELNGSIASRGGGGGFYNCGTGCYGYGGGASGGGVRIMAQKIQGGGSIDVSGGLGPGCCSIIGGRGRVRLDALEDNFGGTVNGAFSRGYQPIIIQSNGQGAQLTITSVGGVPVSASPSGQLATPDAVLSAQQNNPIPIVVHCSNIPLNTQITVSVKPASGAAVSAAGLNSSGSLSSSTATVLINMPRGGGLIYATAAN
jgi:hypothetical protein